MHINHGWFPTIFNLMTLHIPHTTTKVGNVMNIKNNILQCHEHYHDRIKISVNENQQISYLFGSYSHMSPSQERLNRIVKQIISKPCHLVYVYVRKT